MRFIESFFIYIININIGFFFCMDSGMFFKIGIFIEGSVIDIIFVRFDIGMDFGMSF